jgi:hypothetical protein
MTTTYGDVDTHARGFTCPKCEAVPTEQCADLRTRYYRPARWVHDERFALALADLGLTAEQVALGPRGRAVAWGKRPAPEVSSGPGWTERA